VNVRTRFVTDALLCVLAAVLTFAAFPTAWAPDLTFWPLLWVSQVPLLWIVRDKAPRSAFMWGLACGTLINAGGYYWIAEMLQRFGHLPWPVAGLGLILHSVYVGSMWGLWTWGMNRLANTTRVPIQWAAPLVMVAVERVVPRIFPAFMGNSQYPFTALMQIIDVTGVYGVTFLLYRVNAVLFLWCRALLEARPRPWTATGTTAALLAATLVYGAVRIAQVDEAVQQAPKLEVGLVEGDVGIFEVETQDRIRNHLLIQQHMSAKLAAEGAQLILWPESAYRAGEIPDQRAQRWAPATTPLVADWTEDRKRRTPHEDRVAPQRGFEVPLLLGATSRAPRPAPRFEGDTPDMYFNSVFLLDAQGQVAGRYDKNYLLVGGEYIPFSEYFPWIFKWIPAAGDLQPGESLHPIEADLWGVGPVRIGVLVCYEGILPGFARGLAAGRPHFIVNGTNDDWFGLTAERWLHFALTIPRAIEHRVAVLRPTLTGVSAIVDPVGRVVAHTAPTGPETLRWSVPLLQGETLYQRYGDVFAWVCVGLVGCALAYGAARRASLG
jgi:apolipoprotein N-acyltransferase